MGGERSEGGEIAKVSMFHTEITDCFWSAQATEAEFFKQRD